MGRKHKPDYMSTLVTFLIEQGGWAFDVVEREHLYAIGPDFFVRADATRGVIEFGVRKTFDRWCNSCDGSISFDDWLTASDDDYEEIFALARYVLLDKKTRVEKDEFDTIDLRDYKRQFKRMFKRGLEVA